MIVKSNSDDGNSNSKIEIFFRESVLVEET